MSNVIGFLEAMGADARMARMPVSDYLAAVEALNADDNIQSALRARDAYQLAQLLDTRPVMMCWVVSPDNAPEPERSPDQDRPDSPDEPEEK